MRSIRSILVVGIVGTVLVLCSACFVVRRSSALAKEEILARCREMQEAVSSLRQSTALPLVAPQHRPAFGDRNVSLLSAALSPIGPRSSVLVIGDEAVVWPSVRCFVYLVVPVGHSVDMVKVGGKWFFTGEVHID